MLQRIVYTTYVPQLCSYCTSCGHPSNLVSRVVVSGLWLQEAKEEAAEAVKAAKDASEHLPFAAGRVSLLIPLG